MFLPVLQGNQTPANNLGNFQTGGPLSAPYRPENSTFVCQSGTHLAPALSFADADRFHRTSQILFFISVFVSTNLAPRHDLGEFPSLCSL